MDEVKKEKKHGKYCIIFALCFDLICLFFAISPGFFIVFTMFLALPAILLVGFFACCITYGILGLCDNEKTTKSKTQCIVGLCLCVLPIILIIAFLSTGVLVIRFM